MGKRSSAEDVVEKQASSFYITNFPYHIEAQDLWKICAPFVHIVDCYTAKKPSKVGKCFGFVRVLGIKNEVELVKSLANIWIGNHHVFVAVARYQRTKSVNQGSKVEPVLPPRSNGVPSCNEPTPNNDRNSQRANPSRSFASIVNGVISSKDTSNIHPVAKKVIELSDLELVSVDNSLESVLVKVREVGTMINLYRICRNEGFPNVKIHHVGGL
ncbi:RNA-directed DNA polymerase, eukaryota [Tanacetum coccineum]